MINLLISRGPDFKKQCCPVCIPGLQESFSSPHGSYQRFSWPLPGTSRYAMLVQDLPDELLLNSDSMIQLNWNNCQLFNLDWGISSDLQTTFLCICCHTLEEQFEVKQWWIMLCGLYTWAGVGGVLVWCFPECKCFSWHRWVLQFAWTS